MNCSRQCPGTQVDVISAAIMWPRGYMMVVDKGSEAMYKGVKVTTSARSVASPGKLNKVPYTLWTP